MTTINQYINRYKTDQEFKKDCEYISMGTIFGLAFICTLTFIFTLIGYMMQ